MKRVALTLCSVLLLVGCTQAKDEGGAPDVFTIDSIKITNGYEKLQEAGKKLQEDTESVDKELQEMFQAGFKLNEDLKELLAKANNPALTDSAREKYRKEADELAKTVREKEVEINNFRDQNLSILQQRRANVQNMFVEEARKEVQAVAKSRSKGKRLVLDSANPAVVDVSGYPDLTDDVLKRLNDKHAASKKS